MVGLKGACSFSSGFILLSLAQGARGLPSAAHLDGFDQTLTGKGVGVLDIKIPSNRNDDNYYVVDIDFQGQTLPCLLDTGSADLFVATTACSTTNATSGCYNQSVQYQVNNNTRIVSNQTFYTLVGEGWVQGNVSLMDIGLGGVTVDDLGTGLAYAAVANEFQQGSFTGIVGLNMLALSRLNYSYGYQPLVDKLVSGGKLEKPLFSISVPRLGDPESAKVGKLTFGAIEPLYADLDITYSDTVDTQNYNIPGNPYVPQGWTVVLEGIRVNGVDVNMTQGSVDIDNRYLSMFDTGGSDLAVRPSELQAIADLLNGKVVYNNYHDVYFECSVPQLIELKYHGRWIPIDPLDLIVPSRHSVDADGIEMCRAALAPWSRTFADSIIGVPFFRSAFSVFDYVTPQLYAEQPRVGLAPLVDAEAALARYPALYKNRLL